MRLSFVIPTRDTPELLLACLASVAREAPGAQVIVVDDGGSDQIERRARECWSKVVTLRNEVGRGFSAAANAGMAVADGELLVCLNSDTELERGSIGALLRALAEHPDLGVAGGRLLYPDGRPQWSGGAEPNLLWLFALTSGLGRLRGALRRAGPDDEEPAIRHHDWVSGAALAIRRTAWEMAGPFCERYRFYAQDLDLCRRVHDRGFAVAVVGGFRVLHHHGATIARRTAGAPSSQRLNLLWADLADWYEGRRGAAAGMRARRAMRLGAWLRLALTRDPTTRRALAAGLSALAESTHVDG
jgi:GT2 family glycosyltransferase